MSDNNIENNAENPAEALSQEERVEFLKTMFSTLEIDKKLVFTDWCKEECVTGGRELLGQKMQDVNDKMNSFIAKSYDQVVRGAKFVQEETKKAFETDEDNVPKNNSKPNDDTPSFF